MRPLVIGAIALLVLPHLCIAVGLTYGIATEIALFSQGRLVASQLVPAPNAKKTRKALPNFRPPMKKSTVSLTLRVAAIPAHTVSPT